MNDQHRREWLAQLSVLTYPAEPGRAAAAYRAYLPMLVDLPDGAFTRGSLLAVCEHGHKMALRSYDEVSIPLRAWHVENGPLRAALPAPRIPDRVAPTPEVAAAVAALTRQAVGILQEASDIKRGRGAEAKIRPAYLSDGVLLEQSEAALERYAGAQPGTPESAFYALATMRRDGLLSKFGVLDRDAMMAEAAE